MKVIQFWWFSKFYSDIVSRLGLLQNRTNFSIYLLVAKYNKIYNLIALIQSGCYIETVKNFIKLTFFRNWSTDIFQTANHDLHISLLKVKMAVKSSGKLRFRLKFVYRNFRSRWSRFRHWTLEIQNDETNMAVKSSKRA